MNATLRHELRLRVSAIVLARVVDGRECAHCLKPIKRASSGGPAKRFCSDGCRNRWHDARGRRSA